MSSINQANGGPGRHRIPATIFYLVGRLPTFLPSSRLIPAKRQIGAASTAISNLSGKELIDELAKIQNPYHH